MARRRQSVAEEVIDVVATFPWYVGVVLALVSYFALHTYASKGMPTTTGNDIAQAARGGLFYALATFGQYVLPAIFGFGAIVSLMKRSQRKSLYNSVSRKETSIDDVSWQQFEVLVGEHFRRLGYQAVETKSGADGGVDLVLKKDGEKILVQCKHWKAYKVGVKPVRELLGVMASSGAAGGYVITSGQFTTDAKKFAHENQINLVNGRELNRILSNKSNKNSSAVIDNKPIKIEQPICPKCGSDMMLRTAKKGPRAGKKFWSCSKFPKCKSTFDFKN